MNRERQIEEMAVILTDGGCTKCNCDENGKFNCLPMYNAELLYNKGYRKASYVALETVDDFQNRLRHIFVDMCEGNDYNTVNLLEIDSVIENLFDIFVAELKKKYTEEKEDKSEN